MTKDPKISKLHAWRERARMGGGPERIASQHAKGKLTARERLDLRWRGRRPAKQSEWLLTSFQCEYNYLHPGSCPQEEP